MSNLPLFINTQVYILSGPGYRNCTVNSCLCPVFVSVCVFDFTFVFAFVFVCFWSLASAKCLYSVAPVIVIAQLRALHTNPAELL